MIPSAIRVAVCSPFPIVFETLERVLGRQPGVSVSWAGSSPTAALGELHATDVFLLHNDFPIDSVLDAARLASITTPARVVVFGAPPDEPGILRLIEHGSRGYIPRGQPLNAWLSVIHVVAAEGAWIEPRMARALLDRHRELQRRLAHS
jgi:DNA-binding NarL/FixJ family response regulator